VATGIDNLDATSETPSADSLTELAGKLRSDNDRSAGRIVRSAQRPQLKSPARHPEGLGAEPIPEYARQATTRGLDPYDRFSALRNSIQQVVLNISAFLGRKAS
jgi:hypothetical protein